MSIFNFNSQVGTDKNQSERLLALGLKKETADMCWVLADEDREGNKYSVEYMSIGQGKYQLLHPDWYIPAWSLHRLIEIACNGLTLKGDICSDIIFDEVIDCIEHEIKEGYFNKDYLV